MGKPTQENTEILSLSWLLKIWANTFLLLPSTRAARGSSAMTPWTTGKQAGE